MDKKPNVLPTREQQEAINAENMKAKIAAYEAEKYSVTNEIYTGAKVASNDANDPYNYLGQNDSLEAMKRRNDEQMRIKNEFGVIQYPELAEKPPVRKYSSDELDMIKRTQDQMKLRDEAIAKSQQYTQNYQKYTDEATNRRNDYVNPGQNMQQNQNNQYQPPMTPPTNPPVAYGSSYGQNPSNINPYILELSQPNYNAPFDVIPLPSEGKTYRNKKKSIRVSYMTTADENILTSPNLLESGEFLEILINRKLLEPDLRYKDLLIGDRNAIMIWLRATGYGEMYPVTLFDEKDIPFDTEVNLNDLKTKNLGAEPDEEGLFHYQFPLCKAQIKFKMLTCGDTDDIDKMVERDKTNDIPVNNRNTYTMERMIVEINGNRDRNMIRDFANSVRIKDAKDFSTYLDNIECGIDLNITVGTPGGGSVESFLPLNLKFFWPNF